MEKTDEFILNRVMWKAGKYSLSNEYCFFFSDLSPTLQQFLNTHITANSGIPILFFTKPTQEWTLVCSREIIGNDNEGIFRVLIKDIQQFKTTVFDDAAKGKITYFADGKKAEWHKLLVKDKYNNSFVLHANKGASLFAMWNILLMMARMCE